MEPVSAQDERLLDAIARRAAGLGLIPLRPLSAAREARYDLTNALTLCHQTTPLALYELLVAPADAFKADVTGIYRLLDRKTGRFRDGFTPRYTWTARAS